MMEVLSGGGGLPVCSTRQGNFSAEWLSRWGHFRCIAHAIVSMLAASHDKLHFVEEPVEIMDREVKQLRRSRVPIVKVRWNSRRGPEFTWEREDQFRKKYPHLFTKTAPSSSAV
ncbi:hypothetical protein Tco_1344161 [Tanacetum coccineum]